MLRALLSVTGQVCGVRARLRRACARLQRVRLYWNLKNVTEMFYGIPVRVLSVASWFHWSGILLVP